MQAALPGQPSRRLACLAALALGCAGSSPSPSGFSPAEPILQLAEVGFGREFHEGKLFGKARGFSLGDPIVLATGLKLASPGLTLRARWSSGPNLVQSDSAVLTGGPQVVVFPFRNDGQRAEGRYRVFIDVNGEAIGDLSFDVQDPARSEDAVLSFGEGDARPRQLTPTGPPQPSEVPEWLERGRDGMAIVRCTITTEGTAEDCLILRPVWLTGGTVLRWLAEQRWAPASRAGKPVNVAYIFNFRFKHPR